MLLDGPETAPATLLLAHGAGAPMDSPSMSAATQALTAVGLRVARFEFTYMAARRDGQRKPPPRAETLLSEYRDAIGQLDQAKPLIIGGKSMGGRVASMLADEQYLAGRVSGLVCLGYPFHPPGKPTQLRTRHLTDLQTPTLIVQGTRDEFGTPAEVAGYGLSHHIEILWLEDGDHDLKPRKRVSGYSAADHLKCMAERTSDWVKRILR